MVKEKLLMPYRNDVAAGKLVTRDSAKNALGANVDGFLSAMVHVATAFDPGFDVSTVEQRPSKAGNYMGLTLSVRVTSREQLDELYRTLTSHPMVKVAL